MESIVEVAGARRRPYRMKARAEATAATRRAITAAWLDLFAALPYEELTLEAVATHAGVSVQTVIRHFGSKDGLFEAVAREVAAEEDEQRAATPAGDVGAAVTSIVGRYERIGDVVLRLLAQEHRLPALREGADTGRRIHRAWVDRVFAAHLEGRPRGERRRRHGQLVALTDIYVWTVLRRDLGLGRRQTEIAMAEMIDALLSEGS